MRIFSKKKKRKPRRSGIKPSSNPYEAWIGGWLCHCPISPPGWVLRRTKNKGRRTRIARSRARCTTEDGALAARGRSAAEEHKDPAVRSYVTQKDGTYFFHGLSPDVDYEVKAQYNGVWSPPKTVVPSIPARTSAGFEDQEVGRRSLRDLFQAFRDALFHARDPSGNNIAGPASEGGRHSISTTASSNLWACW